jgi:hypothetical protein
MPGVAGTYRADSDAALQCSNRPLLIDERRRYQRCSLP